MKRKQKKLHGMILCLMITSNVADFILVDGNTIYKLKGFSTSSLESLSKLMDNKINSFD